MNSFARSVGLVGLVFGGAVAAAACGSGGQERFGASPDDGQRDLTGEEEPRGPGGQLSSGEIDAGSPDDELAACATEQRKAEQLPLDLFIMLDTSGSMSAQVAQSKSKYKAVSDALGAFVADKGSEGIGVGLQFFPLPTAGTPATCTGNAQCGSGGACTLKICSAGTSLVFCENNSDCATGTCVAAGQCQNAKNVYCRSFGSSCGNDSNGFSRGTCQAQTTGYCSTSDSCVAGDYDQPAVPISALPGGGTAITSALAAKQPSGNTPTSAALRGAVDAASAYASSHPGHTVVAVLATDGLPSSCDTTMSGISAISAAALAAAPSVKTYVIGVFAQDEAATAKANLDQIAAAGGSGQAFIVTAGATTTKQFVDAMNTIRGTALPCEYAIPAPEAGTADFDKLNVQHTDEDGNKKLFPNKAGAGACDAGGGWYYDVPPSSGQPSKIVLCPSTCEDVRAAGGQVDVVVGCKTQVR